jgi:nicotinate phosphoribosyltransferase
MENKIINTLLDSDFYKFTMGQAVLHQFPTAIVEYKFKCRNEGIRIGLFADEIQSEIDNFCTLQFKDEELNWLKTIPFLKLSFIEFLRCFNLNKNFINIKNIDGELDITIRGPWFSTIWFEVPVLSIINEVYFRQFTKEKNSIKIAREKLYKKIDYLKTNVDPSFKLADFGSRRRYSRDWHDEIISILKKELPNNFIGTSNVWLAMKHNIGIIGTMAHEWICGGQNLGPRLLDSQKFMLQKWCDEYRGTLGIALSDTLGFKAFLNDFDPYFAKLFDGCRHDSGNPFEWAKKLIAHYNKFNIDPKTKIAVFSDGLTVEKAVEIWKFAVPNIKTTFGIGTNLTNDIIEEPLNIVIKLTAVNGHSVAKLSDSIGKCMCTDNNYIEYLKSIFGIK